MFIVEEEPASALLRITLSGFWEVETVQRFQSEVASAVGRLACGAGSHRILCDVSAWPTQSQDTARAFAEFIAATPHAPSTRVAVSGASALLRMQINRVAARPTLRTFDDAAEAERWLVTD